MFVGNVRKDRQNASLGVGAQIIKRAHLTAPRPAASGEKLDGHEGYLRLTAFLKKNPMLGF